MNVERKRAWWRKKRWWGLAVPLLVVCYPLSLGPMMYATGRGWGREGFGDVVYAPIVDALNETMRAAATSEVTVQYEAADGTMVEARGQSMDTDMPWWAPTAAAIGERYWKLMTWCGEAGIQHRGRSEPR